MPFLNAKGPLLTLLRDPDVVSRTKAFAASPAVLVHAVCALQGEAAFLSATAPCAEGATLPRFVGSGEATTCLIVFIRAPDGSRAACAHLDCLEAVAPFVEACAAEGLFFEAAGAEPAPPLEVALVGAFAGGDNTVHLVAATLTALQGVACPLTLAVACVLEANVSPAGPPRRPLHAGAALDMATGELRPASFASVGPHELERRARCFVRGAPSPFVAFTRGAWQPCALPEPGSAGGGGGGLEWGVPRSAMARFLAMSDDKLLRTTSTSPEAEAPGYAAKMRETLVFISRRFEPPAPSPLETQ